MSLKKLLFLIKDDEDSGKTLNLDAFYPKLKESVEFKEQLLNLEPKDFDILIKIFADCERPDLAANLITFLNENDADYQTTTLIASLFRFGVIENSDFFIKNVSILEGLSSENSFCLSPFLESFPEKFQKKIEASLAHRKSLVEKFKEHLHDQIEFLKSQQLHNKALEFEKKLKFHFSETTQSLKSYRKNAKKDKDQAFAHIIERSLSFENREKERLRSASKKVFQRLEQDEKSHLDLANLWYQELKDKDIELLLTQLNLMNFNNSDFYEKVLTENTNLSLWTKISLHIKAKKFLEGLELLDIHESTLLTDSADSIYHYYYTKGVLLLGVGMHKEAEEIFTIIKEQKNNYRDIQLLLQESR